MPGPEGVQVRAAQARDLAQLNDIYNHYVRTTHVTFDVESVSMSSRMDWFAGFRDTGPHRLMVAVDDDLVLGYAASKEFRPRPAYRTSVETSVYCRPDATGRGVGSALYGRLFDRLAGEPLHRAYAGVALPNDASLALHRRFGFTEVGTFSEVGHKFDRYWDVLWLEKPLTQAGPSAD